MLLRTLLSIVKNTEFDYFNSYHILYTLYNLLMLAYFRNLSTSSRNVFAKRYFTKRAKSQKQTSFFYLTSSWTKPLL
jgi:hypothetical protein